MKARVLSGAIQRANRELSRRKGVNARKELVENARRALELKQAARLDQAADGGKPASTTASKGMKPKPSTKAPKIGSANEAGRVSQAVKKAQAKKDAGG